MHMPNTRASPSAPCSLPNFWSTRVPWSPWPPMTPFTCGTYAKRPHALCRVSNFNANGNYDKLNSLQALNRWIYVYIVYCECVCISLLYRVTCIHLPVGSKWLYVGTEKGNIHVVHIDTFALSGYIINWNKAIEVWVSHNYNRETFLISYFSSLSPTSGLELVIQVLWLRYVIIHWMQTR